MCDGERELLEDAEVDLVLDVVSRFRRQIRLVNGFSGRVGLGVREDLILKRQS
jgi:hypothetical protein